jgi:hypothetical protein
VGRVVSRAVMTAHYKNENYFSVEKMRKKWI